VAFCKLSFRLFSLSASLCWVECGNDGTRAFSSHFKTSYSDSFQFVRSQVFLAVDPLRVRQREIRLAARLVQNFLPFSFFDLPPLNALMMDEIAGCPSSGPSSVFFPLRVPLTTAQITDGRQYFSPLFFSLGFGPVVLLELIPPETLQARRA